MFIIGYTVKQYCRTHEISSNAENSKGTLKHKSRRQLRAIRGQNQRRRIRKYNPPKVYFLYNPLTLYWCVTLLLKIFLLYI